MESPVKKKHFRHIEAELQQLDPVAWDYLKFKILPLLTVRDPTRGWQALFDTMNEAKGYVYLLSIGCINVRFIPRSITGSTKTPDLEADLNCLRVLCEVKTINISEKEAQARRDNSARQIDSGLTEKFLGKLRSDLHLAKEQLDSYSAEPSTKKIAYMVFNFDDSFHEYADEYRRQIDDFIRNEICDAVEVVLDIKPPFYSATSG